jgi:DNA polymerase
LDDAIALLRLQLEWGADEAIALDPLDRFRAAEPRPGLIGLPASPPPGLAPSGLQPSGPGQVVRPLVAAVAGPQPGSPAERALGLAGRAATLDELRAAMAAFDGCALRDTASNLVFAEGDPAAAILVIGEPPGREEDRSGHPFAGPEGALLDQMLASIGLTRAELMLTPLLPWRPPGGRPVNAGELAVCLPFLHRLIALLQPRRLVVFGGTAVRALLMPAGGRRRPAPGWTEARIPHLPQALPTLALPGMAEMLKNPPVRRDAWAGLRLLRRALNAELTQT